VLLVCAGWHYNAARKHAPKHARKHGRSSARERCTSTEQYSTVQYSTVQCSTAPYSTVQHRATHQQPLARENRYGSMHALPVALIPTATDFDACGGSWLLVLGRSPPPPLFFQSCVEKADHQCTMLLSHRAQTPADAALLFVSQACGLPSASHLPSQEGLAY
jgi:hypothetical protein